MKILYIHQYFVTPAEPGGTRSYWIARELIEHGHDVTMITSSSKYDADVSEKIVNGIKVIYIREDYSQNMSIVRRLKAFVSFMFKSSQQALKQKEIDLVISTSTPLTIGVPALLMKLFKKVPYVFEVRDLWPEVPIQMGAIRNPILIWLTRYFEKLIYRQAQHVIALSPGMQEGVAKYIPIHNTSMIPNMSKKDEFWPREKNIELQNRLGLNAETFKVIHFGSLGIANGAETILESAKLLCDDKTVEFLFVGGGANEQALINECKKHRLNNVHFLGKFPMVETSEIVNLCDLSIVSFKDIPILYTNSPNKLFDTLSAGKPLIVNSAGWTKDLVEEYNCGFYVDPNCPNQLAEKIKYLQANKLLLQEMGEKSRWLAENIFDKSLLCKQFVQVIEGQRLINLT